MINEYPAAETFVRVLRIENAAELAKLLPIPGLAGAIKKLDMDAESEGVPAVILPVVDTHGSIVADVTAMATKETDGDYLYVSAMNWPWARKGTAPSA